MLDIHSVHPALGFNSLCHHVVRFFQFFDQLRRLRMWKMQLLDEHHLFIKYTSEDVVTLRVTDPSQVETHTHLNSSLYSLCCSPLPRLRLLLCVLYNRDSFFRSPRTRFSTDSVQSHDSLMATTNRTNYCLCYLHEISAL